jgi:hypothetical protein
MDVTPLIVGATAVGMIGCVLVWAARRPRRDGRDGGDPSYIPDSGVSGGFGDWSGGTACGSDSGGCSDGGGGGGGSDGG